MPRPPQIIIALLLLATGFLLLAPMLTYPFGSDQGSFAGVADAIARGGLPYRDVWEIKPPGIYYLFWAIFAAGGRSIFSVRLVDLLWTLAAASVLTAVARRLHVGQEPLGPPLAGRGGGRPWRLSHLAPARTAGAFFFLAFYALGFDFWHTAQCDGFASLPAALAVLLLLIAESKRSKPIALASGLLIGLAALLKFTLGPFLIIPLAAALLSRGEALRARLARAASYLAGCLIAFLVTAILLAQAGALRQMLYIVFTWNSQYGEIQPPAPTPIVIAYQVGRFHFWGDYLILKLIGLLALLGLADLVARRRTTPHWWIIPAWWMIAIIGVCAQGKYFAYHWLPVLPPLALLAGAGLAAIARLTSNRLSTKQAGAFVTAVSLFLVCCFAVAYVKRFRSAFGYALGKVSAQEYLSRFSSQPVPGLSGTYFSFTADLAVADYLRSHTRPGDRIFVWGLEPLIYFLADRPPATRFIHDQPLLTPWSPPGWRRQAIRELERSRPRFILIVHHDAQPWITRWPGDSASALSTYPELTDLLRRRYRPAARIEDFDLWERP